MWKLESGLRRFLPPVSRTESSSLPRQSFAQRLFSRRAAILLGRNTVVSTGVFMLGLVLLWLAVERFGMAKVPAAALSFVIAKSIHYVFGRTWIYRGTERRLVFGYGVFPVNALVGPAITLGLLAAFVELGLHYLLARVVASIFAGLALFVLNATLNFKSL